MNHHKAKPDTNRFNELSDTDNSKPNTIAVVRDSITSIGFYAVIVLFAGLGIAIGLIGRLAYEPRPTHYRLDGFVIDLPLRPEIDKLSGIPPFSNRQIVRYTVNVSAAIQYQILVMESDKTQKKDRPEQYNSDSSGENGDLAQWSESTIAVLCADDNHTIWEKCLRPGSRLTRWHLKTADGAAVRGNLVKTRDGRIIQMLATGTSEEDASALFDSYRPD